MSSNMLKMYEADLREEELHTFGRRYVANENYDTSMARFQRFALAKRG